MSEAVPQCEVCGNAMQKNKSWLFHCGRCGFWASALEPGAGTGIDGLEDLRRRNNEAILDRLEQHGSLNGKRLLEVGSAWGWFLEAASDRGAITHAIEPEDANVKLSRERFAATHPALEIEHGFFPDDLADRGPYDVVVFNDVFEHIPNPSQVIASVAGILAPGGIAVINIPSSQGVFFRLSRLLDRFGFSSPLERLWLKGFSSPHISFFNKSNLTACVTRNTTLRNIDWFPLVPISRDGLYSRVRATHGGPVGASIFVAVWLMSFVLPWLPADNQVALYQAPS